MSKYGILENKLNTYYEKLNDILENNEMLRKQLDPYIGFLQRISDSLKNKTLAASKGRKLGVSRGISDYDLLSNDDDLWKLAKDIDDYYAEEFK